VNHCHNSTDQQQQQKINKYAFQVCACCVTFVTCCKIKFFLNTIKKTHSPSTTTRMQALDKLLRVVAIGGALTIPAAATLYPILYTVDGGQRVIIMDYYQQKVLEKVVDEGTHIRWPVIQKPIFFDVRTKYRSIPTATGTKGIYYHA
jgi:hypothetical protein